MFQSLSDRQRANLYQYFQFDFLIDIVPREEIHKASSQPDGQPGGVTNQPSGGQQQQQQQQQNMVQQQGQAQTLQLTQSGNNGGQVSCSKLFFLDQSEFQVVSLIRINRGTFFDKV